MNTPRNASGKRLPVRLWPAIVLVAATGFAAGCSKKQDAAAGQDTTDVVLVSVQRPNVDDAVRTLTVTGDIRADRQVTIASLASGRIIERRVDLGDRVERGQVIAVIDHSQLDPQVEQMRAGLAAAETQAANLAVELQRVERLLREGGASEQQADQVRTQKRSADEGVRQARAALDGAQARRSDATVRAPFSGLIGKLMVEVGDMAGPGMPIGILVDPRPLIAAVRIPERDLGAVRPGQKVLVSVASYAGELFAGTVRRISPVLDQATRMADVEVLLPNNDLRLKPGMFATINIELDRRPNAVMVPSDVVIQETRLDEANLDEVRRTYYVYVKSDSIAQRRQVTLGYMTGEKVEIRSGLTPQDTVVVEGQHLLRDGKRISVKTATANAT